MICKYNVIIFVFIFFGIKGEKKRLDILLRVVIWEIFINSLFFYVVSNWYVTYFCKNRFEVVGILIIVIGFV